MMQLVKLVFWVLLCQIPAWIGMNIVQHNMMWYHSLQKPLFSPPDWLFGMVWAVLYVLLAVSAYYLTRNGVNTNNRKALWLFIVQLALNAAWVPVFFGMHALMLAMVIVLVMIVLTAWYMRAAKSTSCAAVWMMIPYLAWICFAWVLNASMWIMN